MRVHDRNRSVRSILAWRYVLGALCWMCCCHFFVVEYAVASVWPHRYSYFANYVSDLGDTACGFTGSGAVHRYVCSPWHAAMNASLVTVGLLVIVGAILTYPAWPRRRLATAGLVLVCLSGVGVVIIATSPENVRFWVHALTGVAEFPLQNVGMILLGLAVWPISRWSGALSVGLGGIGAVCTALYFTHGYASVGVGVIERLAVYPAVVWLVIIGSWLLVRGLRMRPPAEG